MRAPTERGNPTIQMGGDENDDDDDDCFDKDDDINIDDRDDDDDDWIRIRIGTEKGRGGVDVPACPSRMPRSRRCT